MSEDLPVQRQRASAAAIVLSSTVCLALMWAYADEYARAEHVTDPTGFGGAGAMGFAYVLPLVVGFGVGRHSGWSRTPARRTCQSRGGTRDRGEACLGDAGAPRSGTSTDTPPVLTVEL